MVIAIIVGIIIGFSITMPIMAAWLLKSNNIGDSTSTIDEMTEDGLILTYSKKYVNPHIDIDLINPEAVNRGYYDKFIEKQDEEDLKRRQPLTYIPDEDDEEEE